MRTDLLRNLMRFLYRFRPRDNRKKKRKFDMSKWWNETKCGTAACAAGYACNLPSFQKAGFQLQTTYPTHDGTYKYPTYKGHANFEALAKGLGISVYAASGIFSEDSYLFNNARSITPYRVARRIEAFLKMKNPNVVWDVHKKRWVVHNTTSQNNG